MNCDFFVDITKIAGDNGDNLYNVKAGCNTHQGAIEANLSEKDVDNFLAEGFMHVLAGNVPAELFRLVESKLLSAANRLN